MDDKFANALEEDGRDLVCEALSSKITEPRFREREIKALLDQLEQRRSVVLVGPTGVGKTAVIHGAAHALAKEYRLFKIVELSTIAVMSGTRWLGEWETKLTEIIRSAKQTRSVLYFTDILNLSSAGRSSNANHCMLDAIRTDVESGKLVLLGELTPEMLRNMERLPRFAGLFIKQEITPMSPDCVDKLLHEQSISAGVDLDRTTRRTIIQLTERFLPARSQPAPALTFLQHFAAHLTRGKKSKEKISSALIERVFSRYTGLPLFVVSRHATMATQNIRNWFQERITGQRDAIEAVIEIIAVFKAGLNDPNKPLGTLLFVGPTGVGKTELARSLATFLFGTPERLLRFDLSEYKDYHSFEMLLGSSHSAQQQAKLLDPVRAQPFQVILLDELEKAHPNICDLLLQLLDEGRLTAPNGDAVDFRRTIIIATTNAGSRELTRNLGFDSKREPQDRGSQIRRALTGQFRSEFLNRFQHIVLFHSLTREQVRTIARNELQRVLNREGFTDRNVIVEVDDRALDIVIDKGYDSHFGARALKREIHSRIVLPLALVLVEQRIRAGQTLRVFVKDDQIHAEVVNIEQRLPSDCEQESVSAAS